MAAARSRVSRSLLEPWHVAGMQVLRVELAGLAAMGPHILTLPGQHGHGRDPDLDLRRHCEPAGVDFAVIQDTVEKRRLPCAELEERRQARPAFGDGLRGARPPCSGPPLRRRAASRCRCRNSRGLADGKTGSARGCAWRPLLRRSWRCGTLAPCASSSRTHAAHRRRPRGSGPAPRPRRCAATPACRSRPPSSAGRSRPRGSACHPPM